MPVTDPAEYPAETEVPARYDPAEPIGPEPAPAPVPVTFDPPVVIIECVVPVRDERPDQWSVLRVTLAGEEVRRIAGRHDGRRSLLVKNIGAAGAAYIGADVSMSATAASLPVAVGESLRIEATAPVYAVSDAGTTPTLVIVAEYDKRAPSDS